MECRVIPTVRRSGIPIRVAIASTAPATTHAAWSRRCQSCTPQPEGSQESASDPVETLQRAGSDGGDRCRCVRLAAGAGDALVHGAAGTERPAGVFAELSVVPRD